METQEEKGNLGRETDLKSGNTAFCNGIQMQIPRKPFVRGTEAHSGEQEWRIDLGVSAEGLGMRSS